MDFKQAYDICRKKMDIHIDKYPLNVPEVGGCKDGRYYDKEWKTPLVNKWTWLGSFITGFGPLFYKKEKSNELLKWTNKFRYEYHKKMFGDGMTYMHDIGFVQTYWGSDAQRRCA